MPPSDSPLIPAAPLPVLHARFAWVRDEPGRPGGETCLFRRSFEIAEVPASFRIHVTADCRYVLWLNGERLGRGPLKGVPAAYQVETYELAPRLRPGRNVLAAEVRWFGEEGPISEVHSHRPGWWVQGPESAGLDTPGDWRVLADPSVRPNVADTFHGALEYLGPLDRVDARLRPAGWRAAAFDDSTWPAAVQAGPPTVSEGWGLAPLRRLVPRELPALEETPREFPRVWLRRRPSALPFHVPAGEGGEIWLEADGLTTSYPVLAFEGGAGREVRMVYAEALGHWRSTGGVRVWVKAGRRDDVATLDPHGYHDALVLPGGRYDFEPFHWRAFWFVKVEILSGPEPVTLREAAHRFTSFPHVFDARFTCDRPEIGRLWTISLRTLRLCAHETYEDCPYFEQLNYVADSRLQALCTYYLGNDTRLARRCLETVRDSLGPEGLTASRAPCRRRQLIPAFSLHWILMLRDLWRWSGEAERAFAHESLVAVDAVLGYFRDRVNADGFVGRIDDWAWVDWVPGWPHGVAPAVAAGTGSTYLTGFLAVALDAAAELHRAVGVPADAHRWERLAARLRGAIGRRAWSEERGLFLEGPGRDDPPTQHTQALALLSGAARGRCAARVASRLVEDDSLVSMSLFQRFYLARALESAGRYEAFFDRVLAPWKGLLDLGIGTWLEAAGPSRSDCHAWASWMVHDFFACLLGARPAAPGWTRICIRPAVTAVGSAAGAFSMPTGRLSVDWKTRPDGTVDLRVEAPQGIPVTVMLPDGVREFPRGGFIAVCTEPEPAAATV